jgi:predicted DNA-binding protein
MTKKKDQRKVLSFRAEADVNARIQAMCAATKKRPSAFLREAALAHLDEETRLSLLDLKLSGMVSGAAAHLRQVAAEVMTDVEDVARNVALEMSGVAVRQGNSIAEVLARLEQAIANLPQSTGNRGSSTSTTSSPTTTGWTRGQAVPD